MSKTILPEGFTCECGTFHRFTVYVAAHWREALMHTCEVCQAEHQIQRGKAALIKAGTKQEEKQ